MFDCFDVDLNFYTKFHYNHNFHYNFRKIFPVYTLDECKSAIKVIEKERIGLTP